MNINTGKVCLKPSGIHESRAEPLLPDRICTRNDNVIMVVFYAICIARHFRELTKYELVTLRHFKLLLPEPTRYIIYTLILRSMYEGRLSFISLCCLSRLRLVCLVYNNSSKKHRVSIGVIVLKSNLSGRTQRARNV